MFKIQSYRKLTAAIILMLCLSAVFTVVVFSKVSGQQMVIAHARSDDPSKCRVVVDKSGEEKPCFYPAISGSFTETTEREAIARGLIYIAIGNQGHSATIRQVADIVDATDGAYATRIAPTLKLTRLAERWVVTNGRFEEIGEVPLKPNYMTETIMLTEVNAQKYGFTVYVPVTRTYEDAHDELMRILNYPSGSASQSQ